MKSFSFPISNNQQSRRSHKALCSLSSHSHRCDVSHQEQRLVTSPPGITQLHRWSHTCKIIRCFYFLFSSWSSFYLLNSMLKDLNLRVRHSLVNSSISFTFSKQNQTKWKCFYFFPLFQSLILFFLILFFLVGKAPLVIARGGFSGLFPDSSVTAYSFVSATSVPDAVLWCDVQLTKDGVGICFPNVTMSKYSDVEYTYPERKNSYLLNGVPTHDWFTIDFTSKDLNSVFCKFGLSSLADILFSGHLILINLFFFQTLQWSKGYSPGHRRLITPKTSFQQCRT